jgi:hypothetical protein
VVNDGIVQVDIPMNDGRLVRLTGLRSTIIAHTHVEHVPML